MKSQNAKTLELATKYQLPHSRLLMFVFCLFCSPQVWSQGSVTVGGPTNNQAPPPAASSTPAPVSTAGSNNSLTNAAGSSKSGSDLAIIGQVITGGVGVYMATMCGPHTIMPCVLAAQCALQLVQSASAQSGTDGVYGAYSPTDGLGGNYGGGDPNGGGSANGGPDGGPGTKGPGGGLAPGPAADLAKIKGGLANAGVSIDSATGAITLPNGQTVPANSTASSLKASGFDSASVDQTMADEKRMENKLLASAKAGAFSYQGGGGGGRAVAHAANPNDSMDLNSLLNAGRNNGNRKPGSAKASVAGLSKKLGSENIGVKGDNIFEMVNRRYQSQHKQNAFLRDN